MISSLPIRGWYMQEIRCRYLKKNKLNDIIAQMFLCIVSWLIAMQVIKINHHSPVLTKSSLRCLEDIPAINITAGCAHGCVYCYARGYSNYPGDGKILVYENTLEKLKHELFNKKHKPKVVYFSPSSDIFQPIKEVNDLSHAVIEYLFSKNIGISFLTKGQIPENTLNLLIKNAEKVKAQIGIITADDCIRNIFEPNAASISIRLDQMVKMVAGGIAVEARMMPIVPGFTDNKHMVNQLFSFLSSIGIKRVAISTLFLRPVIAASLRRLITNLKTIQNLLNLYIGEEKIGVRAKNSSIIPLPHKMRENIYNNIKTIAKKYQIDVSICGCMNPDIGGSCNIKGEWLSDYSTPNTFNRYSLVEEKQLTFTLG